MGQESSIEWTDHTFNPWWGCTKVSIGCQNCYAETWANRYGHDLWGNKKERRKFGSKHWRQPYKWNEIARKRDSRPRVFCASMADVFEDNPLLEAERNHLWRVIEDTAYLDWLLLTKRPQKMIEMTPWESDWPVNVWALTSTEDQAQFDTRVPALVDVPARIRGLSAEPLLGPIDMTAWLEKIDWVIVGGESGRAARPMHPNWVRSIRDQCKEYGVAFFFKQWGCWVPEEGASKIVYENVGQRTNGIQMKRVSKKKGGRHLDGSEWNAVPVVPNHTILYAAVRGTLSAAKVDVKQDR